MKVLIIDDDIELCNSLKLLLEQSPLFLKPCLMYYVILNLAQRQIGA